MEIAVAQAAFGEGVERAAEFFDDRAQRVLVVGEQPQLGERVGAEILADLIGTAVPAPRRHDLGDMCPIERAKRVVNVGVGLAALVVEDQQRLLAVARAHGRKALLDFARGGVTVEDWPAVDHRRLIRLGIARDAPGIASGRTVVAIDDIAAADSAEEIARDRGMPVDAVERHRRGRSPCPRTVTRRRPPPLGPQRQPRQHPAAR